MQSEIVSSLGFSLFAETTLIHEILILDINFGHTKVNSWRICFHTANPVKPKNLFIYTMNELPGEKS